MKITRIITVAALALFSLEALDATAEALPVVAEASVLQIRLPPPPPRPPNPFRRRHRRPVVRRHRRIHIKLPPRPPAPPNPLHLPTPPHP
jgi:hypothetical protein